MKPRRLLVSAVVAAGLLALPAAPPSSAQEGEPALAASPGTVECWGPGNRSTLWHFIVFNHGTAAGRYRVEYKWTTGSKVRAYSGRVPQKQGVNDGILIRPGKKLDFVRVLADGATIMLAGGISGRASCGR